MRRDLAEVENDLCSVYATWIRPRRILLPVLNVFIAEALDSHRCQSLLHSSEIRNRDLVDREPAHQRPPLCGHIRDGKPGINGKTRHAGPGELYSSVQDFIVVVEPTQGDDYILAGCTLREFAVQNYLNRARDLPPELASCPNGRGIGPYDRCAYRTQRAIHIRMRI